LMPGTLEFAIHTLVETRLDTSGFEQKYRNDETGRTAYDPKILLKIVLLGFARGLVSSRKIEQAWRENVVFIALACWKACATKKFSNASKGISFLQKPNRTMLILARKIINFRRGFILV
jgi:transposase